MEENISYIDGLILSFLKEEITEAERKALEDWINADPSNKEHFKSFYRIWNATYQGNGEVEMALQKVKLKLSNTPFEENEQQNTGARSFTLLKWAAVIVISCITGAFGYKYLSHAGKQRAGGLVNVINVPLGSKSNVLLPDGTQVTLNAGSRLTYGMDYGIKLREVNLIGEGYFKVAENKNAPFLVKTVKATIKALGTEFNVKAYPEEGVIETVLVKGSVLVDEILSTEEKKTDKRKTVILKPGQKVLIYKVAEKDKPVEEVNSPVLKPIPQKIVMPPMIVINNSVIENETSWKDTRWIIKGTDLQTFAVILSRRFNVSIELQDENLKQYRFSGTIENETIEEVFDIMKYTIPISYTIDKGKVTWTIDRNLEKVYKESY